MRLWEGRHRGFLVRSKFQFQKVRLWVLVCSIAKELSDMFQFQKVRLWASGCNVKSTAVSCFNSKRCDYETTKKQCPKKMPSFNSKRCDYEETINLEIYKKRLCFNSKRCDYELKFSTEQQHSCLSFNSKRCDYEKQRELKSWKKILVSIPKGAIMRNK